MDKATEIRKGMENLSSHHVTMSIFLLVLPPTLPPYSLTRSLSLSLPWQF